jgi:hypothetical protein
MTRWPAWIPALLLLAAAAPAAAVDFTINVQVTVENMPAAQRVGAVCEVHTSPDGSTRPGSRVGGTSATRPVTGGNFSGIVTVAFDADAGRPPALARSYACTIIVYGVGPDGRAFDGSYNALVDTWLAATGQRITVTPTRVAGPLTP